MPTLLEPVGILDDTIDYPRLMDKLGGDQDLFKELVAIFVEEHPGWLAEVRRCIDAGSAAGLGKIAHQVRGVAGHFGAKHVAPLAAALEIIGRTGALADAERHFLPLEIALGHLGAALQHFADEIDGRA